MIARSSSSSANRDNSHQLRFAKLSHTNGNGNTRRRRIKSPSTKRLQQATTRIRPHPSQPPPHQDRHPLASPSIMQQLLHRRQGKGGQQQGQTLLSLQLCVLALALVTWSGTGCVSALRIAHSSPPHGRDARTPQRGRALHHRAVAGPVSLANSESIISTHKKTLLQTLDMVDDQEYQNHRSTRRGSRSGSSSDKNKGNNDDNDDSGRGLTSKSNSTMELIDFVFTDPADESLASCAKNLHQADGSDNELLKQNEYANFLALESDGRIDSSGGFSGLDTSFIAIFFAESCSTCFIVTQMGDCCIGSANANINLTQSNLTQYVSTVRFVCFSVESELERQFPPPFDSVATSSGPSPNPSLDPTPAPSTFPSTTPTDHPSQAPSVVPSHVPTASPTASPTSFPSVSPSVPPSLVPSTTPSIQPSLLPSKPPTQVPSLAPTTRPSLLPSVDPSDIPTTLPSISPSQFPSSIPSTSPSTMPSLVPSLLPSLAPSSEPSQHPTSVPSASPSAMPSLDPSPLPSLAPSSEPSEQPTNIPSASPSASPNAMPSSAPSPLPSLAPSSEPSEHPTSLPSASPSTSPSAMPSLVPSPLPSIAPSGEPSEHPTSLPSASPSTSPSAMPSLVPSSLPSIAPSSEPSEHPTSLPSASPSAMPSLVPSSLPTSEPSEHPTNLPSASPSEVPTLSPTSPPSNEPTSQPSSEPSASPSHFPSPEPSPSPSRFPSSEPSTSPSRSPSSEPSTPPSRSPSSTPSASPSELPTSSPSISPSVNPSGAPSPSPSGQPSVGPTETPSHVPSALPTLVPSSVPSSSPSAKPIVCTEIMVIINNTGMLSGDDVLTQNGNTLITGLVEAGRNITIEILNATFPRSRSTTRRLSLGQFGYTQVGGRGGSRPSISSDEHSDEEMALRLGLRDFLGEDGFHQVLMEDGELPSKTQSFSSIHIQNHNHYMNAHKRYNLTQLDEGLQGRRLRGSGNDPLQEHRRLPIFEDDRELSEIVVAVSTTCGVVDGFECLVVVQRNCAILEPGDDETAVQNALVIGFEAALESGTYMDAIPPEHIP